MILYVKYHEIGPAIWLLLTYYAHCRDDGSEWLPVLDGQAVVDEDAAQAMSVSVHTVIRWRKRLEAAGVIITERQPRGFAIWAKMPWRSGQAQRTEAPPENAYPWPRLLTIPRC
jgi:hypothetical protein